MFDILLGNGDSPTRHTELIKDLVVEELRL